MANNVENKLSFIPTGMEIVLHNDQETKNLRECTSNVIAAEPISWWRPEDVFGEAEGDGSTGKRKRSELKIEKEKEFSLVKIYRYSNNIDEIILQREKDGITLDSEELLKNLKGWTVRKRIYPRKNGRNRVDKTYGHPKSKRLLRSTVEIMKFIEEISCKRKASKSSERVSRQVENVQDATTKMYLEISRRLEEKFGNSAHQTSHNSNKRPSSSSWSLKHEAIRVPETAYDSTYIKHDTHLHRPSHYPVSFFSSSHGAPLSSHIIHAPQSENISDTSKQVITDNGQGCVRTFGVGQPACYNFCASSSLKNKASLNKINMMVQSQLEMPIETKVAAQVAKTVSHYEKAQKEMAEKIESMERLLLIRGKSPPFQFPNARKS